MSDDSVSFLTPYLTGAEMMRIHLESIRRFHPDAPILVSKKGAGVEEMERYREDFGVRYWIEDCEYEEALKRLLQRCGTKYACILDHDTVLLAGIDPMLEAIASGRYDLVGIEERIRVPDPIWKTRWPQTGGWLRFAPGYMDATFLLFDLHSFVRQWGPEGLWTEVAPKLGWSWEAHYGLCEKLSRHYYLRPYHTGKYGLANVLKDAGAPCLVHLWYGSHRGRLLGTAPEETIPFGVPDAVVRQVVEDAERSFLADAPDWDFSECTPAWAPQCDMEAECRHINRVGLAIEEESRRLPYVLADWRMRIRRWRSYGVRGFLARVVARIVRRLIARIP